MRALGAERFRTTRFVTEPAELEPDGWHRYELGEAADGPLTEEEKLLRGVRAEEEAGKNTTERRQLVGGRVQVGISAEARGALEALGRDEGENLVQLVGFIFVPFSRLFRNSNFLLASFPLSDPVRVRRRKIPYANHNALQQIDIPSETIQLANISSATAADLATSISATEPRYSFFRYPLPNSSSWALVFIFTCPPETKIKARMVYASSKLTFLAAVKEDMGLSIAKRVSKHLHLFPSLILVPLLRGFLS